MGPTQPQLISEGRLAACSAPSFSACLFPIGEFKSMLSDWLTVLHTHVQSRFHVFLMICKMGVGNLPFNFFARELRMCLAFPTLPLRGSIKLGPCDRCFGPEWIPFRIHRLIYSLSPGFWQSFVTIRSCNCLVRIVSTYVGNFKEK